MISEIYFPERDVPTDVPGDVVPLSWAYVPGSKPVEAPYLYRLPGDPFNTVRCSVSRVTCRILHVEALALRPAGAPPGARLVGGKR